MVEYIKHISKTEQKNIGNKGVKMEIVYNPELKGWQIVYTPNQFINKEMWNKPANDKVFKTWYEASHYLDKCE